MLGVVMLSAGKVSLFILSRGIYFTVVFANDLRTRCGNDVWLAF